MTLASRWTLSSSDFGPCLFGSWLGERLPATRPGATFGSFSEDKISSGLFNSGRTPELRAPGRSGLHEMQRAKM